MALADILPHASDNRQQFRQGLNRSRGRVRAQP